MTAAPLPQTRRPRGCRPPGSLGAPLAVGPLARAGHCATAPVCMGRRIHGSATAGGRRAPLPHLQLSRGPDSAPARLVASASSTCFWTRQTPESPRPPPRFLRPPPSIKPPRTPTVEGADLEVGAPAPPGRRQRMGKRRRQRLYRLASRLAEKSLAEPAFDPMAEGMPPSVTASPGRVRWALGGMRRGGRFQEASV